MYKNDLIFMTTTTPTEVATNALVPLTTIARRRGCACQNSLNGVTLTKSGYYKVTATITLTGDATGTATIDVEKSGVFVGGITASRTVSVADTQLIEITLVGIVRVFCNEGQPTINLVNRGVAITTNNVALAIEYLG